MPKKQKFRLTMPVTKEMALLRKLKNLRKAAVVSFVMPPYGASYCGKNLSNIYKKQVKRIEALGYTVDEKGRVSGTLKT